MQPCQYKVAVLALDVTEEKSIWPKWLKELVLTLGISYHMMRSNGSGICIKLLMSQSSLKSKSSLPQDRVEDI